MSFNFMAEVTICCYLEPKKIKTVTVSIVSPSICHEVMGPDAMILSFFSFKLNLSSIFLSRKVESVYFTSFNLEILNFKPLGLKQHLKLRKLALFYIWGKSQGSLKLLP